VSSMKKIAALWGGAGLLLLAGCSLLGRGPSLPVPDQVVFLFTGETGGELKGCG